LLITSFHGIERVRSSSKYYYTIDVKLCQVSAPDIRAIASKFLSGKDLAKVIVTPSRFEPPGFDATLGRLLLFQEVERHLSQDDKVLLTVVGCRMRLAAS
jgi:hypothetical protein